MRLLATAVLCLLTLASSVASAAKDEPLVADLSEHFIKITADFTGARVLLFGAIENEGKVVIVVRGPTTDFTVRRKEKVGGLLWINRRNIEFASVPSFYRVLTSEPLGNWLPVEMRKRHEIGVEYLNIQPIGAETRAEGDAFRRALIRNMRRTERFGVDENSVKIIRGKLFRANLVLPANVATGYYNVDVLLIEGDKVRNIQSTPLQVRKAGIEDQVYRMAYDYPAVYGIVAIVIAVFAGLAANAAFRKV